MTGLGVGLAVVQLTAQVSAGPDAQQPVRARLEFQDTAFLCEGSLYLVTVQQDLITRIEGPQGAPDIRDMFALRSAIIERLDGRIEVDLTCDADGYQVIVTGQPDDLEDAEPLELRFDFRDGVLLDPPEVRVSRVHDAPYLLQALFAPGSAELAPDQVQAVRRAAVWLMRWQAVRVQVAGMTDAAESEAAGQALSVARARAVADALTRFGVDPSIIEIEGRGANDLAFPTPPGTSDPRNRRATITMVGPPDRRAPPPAGA